MVEYAVELWQELSVRGGDQPANQDRPGWGAAKANGRVRIKITSHAQGLALPLLEPVFALPDSSNSRAAAIFRQFIE